LADDAYRHKTELRCQCTQLARRGFAGVVSQTGQAQAEGDQTGKSLMKALVEAS
jgi:hypothetical protein